MRSFLFLSLSFVFSSALAQAEVVKANGQDVNAIGVERFMGSSLVHSFELLAPVTFSFAGNPFTAQDKVYLHPNGNIALLISTTPQELKWQLGEKTLSLDCGPHSVIGANPMNRAVGFHPNQVYRRGCTATTPFEFTDAVGSKLTVFGDIDLDLEARLEYASKVGYGALKIGSQTVQLFPSSSIGYAEGKIRFFTLTHGQTFEVDHPTYGKLVVTQREGRHASTILFPNGQLEKGVLAKAITHHEVGLEIPAGAGVEFSETGILTTVAYAKPEAFALKGYSLLAQQFYWDTERDLYNILTAAPFEFTYPRDGQKIQIPAGSKITYAKDGEILGIQGPEPRGSMD